MAYRNLNNEANIKAPEDYCWNRVSAITRVGQTLILLTQHRREVEDPYCQKSVAKHEAGAHGEDDTINPERRQERAPSMKGNGTAQLRYLY